MSHIYTNSIVPNATAVTILQCGTNVDHIIPVNVMIVSLVCKTFLVFKSSVTCATA